MTTIKEIAEKAGVSIGTVDRVLHKRGRVSVDTRKRIEKIIKELNYKPNLYARQLKLSKDYRFAALLPKADQDSRYWRRPLEGIMLAQQELVPHKINVNLFHFDRYSEESFLDTARTMLHSDPDGILIAPVLKNPAKEIFNRIHADQPYVFIDSDIPSSERLAFIGQDPLKSGKLSARLMNLLVENDGDVAVIRFMPEDYHIDQRIKGFREFFIQNTHVKIHEFEWRDLDRSEQFNTLGQKIMKETSNLKGIFIPNALTYKIAEFIESCGLLQKIHIIGYDLIDENVEYLKKGVIDFLISQSPIAQGYQGIYSLYRHVVLKEELRSTIMMPIDIVTEENIEFYVNSLKVIEG